MWKPLKVSWVSGSVQLDTCDWPGAVVVVPDGAVELVDAPSVVDELWAGTVVEPVAPPLPFDEPLLQAASTSIAVAASAAPTQR